MNKNILVHCVSGQLWKWPGGQHFFVGEKHSETHMQKMGEICPLAMFPESLTVDLEPKPIYSGVSHIIVKGFTPGKCK